MSYRDSAPAAFRPPHVGAIAVAAARRRRRAIATGAALMALIAGSAVALANGVIRADGPPPLIAESEPPTGDPTSDPTREPLVIVPAKAMLTTDDLGPGYLKIEEGPLSGWHLAEMAKFCQGYVLPAIPQAPRWTGDRERLVRNETGGVRQALTLTSDTYAMAVMEQMRGFVHACPELQYGGGPKTRLEIAAEGFVGHESLVVKMQHRTWVLVRQGAVLTEILFAESESLDRVMAVAQTAAAHVAIAIDFRYGPRP